MPVKQEIIYPFFLETCQYCNDIFWETIMEDLAYGKPPHGTYISKGFLCCSYKNKEFSYKLERKDPKILYQNIYDLLTEKLGILSYKEKAQKRLAKYELLLGDFLGQEGESFELAAGNKQWKIKSLLEALAKVKELGKEGMTIQRYKGLGEMNPDQLWETTMNPATRTVLKVTLEDVVEADEMFTVLMGDQVEPRRQFIERYAKAVRNLDI